VIPGIRKELGKIESIDFGMGGYDDAMLGFSVTLSGDAWSVGDFKGFWAPNVRGGDDCMGAYAEAMAWAGVLMLSAKKAKLRDLVGVPVEVTFDGNVLKSWRVLKEVL
jgi:hypothetical protein